MILEVLYMYESNDEVAEHQPVKRFKKSMSTEGNIGIQKQSLSQYSPSPIASSPESSPSVLQTKHTVKKPLIEVQYNINEKSFSISVGGKERPATSNKGGAQHDHVTAYTIFVEIIYSAVSDEPIKEVPQHICDIARCFLFEDKYERLENLRENKLKDINDNVLLRKQRKKLTKHLRALREIRNSLFSNGKNYDSILKKGNKDNYNASIVSALDFLSLDESKIEQIKLALKNNYDLQLINLVVDMSKEIISSVNKQRFICFPKQRRDIKETTPGVKEKQALKALRALNQLIKIKINTNSKKRDLLLKQFCKDRDLYFGLKGTKKAEKFNIDIKNYNQENLNAIDLGTIVKQAGLFFEWLFDFTKTSNTETNNTKQYEILFEISARHIVLLFSAFKYLRELSVDLQEKIVDEYLSCVLKNQGWEGSKLIDETTLDEIELNLEVYKNRINDFATIDYKNKQFVMNKGNEQLVSEDIFTPSVG